MCHRYRYRILLCAFLILFINGPIRFLVFFKTDALILKPGPALLCILCKKNLFWPLAHKIFHLPSHDPIQVEFEAVRVSYQPLAQLAGGGGEEDRHGPLEAGLAVKH
jgi:hypothetical protein